MPNISFNDHREHLSKYYSQKLEELKPKVAAILQEYKYFEDLLSDLNSISRDSKFPDIENDLTGNGQDSSVDTTIANHVPVDNSYKTFKISTILPAYDPNWTWIKRAMWVIASQKKPLTVSMVVNAILAKQPEYIPTRRTIVSTVSTVLATNAGDGKKLVKSYNEEEVLQYDIA